MSPSDLIREERQQPASPACCDVMKKFAAIMISFVYESTFKSENSDEWKACWHLRLDSKIDTDFYIRTEQMTYSPAPTFCPYCGKPLPPLRKKTVVPSPLCRTTDMNYCETCGERLMNCCCWPVQSAWEAF